MAEMVSFGANFVKVYDENSEVYLLFRCREDVILNDRVVEEAKKYANSFIDYCDTEALYKLYGLGWYLHSVTE